MENVRGIYHIVSEDPKDFYAQVRTSVASLVKDGQKVEIQYQTDTLNGILVYSTLIIGRKEENK